MSIFRWSGSPVSRLRSHGLVARYSLKSAGSEGSGYTPCNLGELYITLMLICMRLQCGSQGQHICTVLSSKSQLNHTDCKSKEPLPPPRWFHRRCTLISVCSHCPPPPTGNIIENRFFLPFAAVLHFYRSAATLTGFVMRCLLCRRGVCICMSSTVRTSPNLSTSSQSTSRHTLRWVLLNT